MKKFFGYSGILLAILLLLVGTVLFFRLQQFRKSIDQLKQDGFPVSVADLNVDGTKAQKETMRLISEAIGPANEFDLAMWEFTEENGNESGVIDEQTKEKFQELIAKHPDLFETIEKISNCTEVETKMEGDLGESMESLLQRVQDFRGFARVLQWKARVLAADGKPDEALGAGLQILRISQLASQNPMLVSQLVGHAIKGIGVGIIYELISNHEVTDQARQQLHDTLEALEATNYYSKSLEGERAYGISMITELGTIRMAHGGIGYLRMINEEIANANKENFELPKRATNGTGSSLAALMNGWAGESLFPALQQVNDANGRTRSQVRGLRIYSALNANPENIPELIDQKFLIAIGVPKAMTVDTMSGDTMIVKRVDDQWKVYSVGSNLIDDGGTSVDRLDFVLEK